MAGDWIKFEVATLHKPEITLAAEYLGISRRETLGIFLDYWAWLDANTRHACVTHVSRKSLEAVLQCTGLAAVLELIGWVKFDDEAHQMTITNYERHNGESAKTRALARNRKAAERSRNRLENVTPREEKRRVLKPITPTPLVAALPEWLSSDTWEQFEKHRAACKARLTTRGRELALKTLGKLKAAGGDPVAIIEQSIERGWKGLFPVDQPKAGTATAAWWTSEPATIAKGKELGIAPRGGESMADYRGRISEAVQARASA